LRAALRHAVFPGGKRLRSQLLLECAGVVGGGEFPVDCALPFACAVELIHAYSLVHDDLPSMDDAPTRRGLPSCHIAFDEATAILVGDALQTLAFETMALDGLGHNAERELRAIRTLARASGEAGMVGGQQMDIDWSGDTGAEISGAQLSAMHALKTGALIKASCEAGAILGGANEDELVALGEYGAQLGRAFQIHDDVLDVEGDPALMGKASTDARNLKMTAPGVYGLESAKRLALDANEAAVQVLAPFGERAETLRRLACFVVSRES
jgi:geranylgeranyl diphosphate synthase type II